MNPHALITLASRIYREVVTLTEEFSTRRVRVLFVCTANVARSPYAERRAQVLLRKLPFAFESAGAPGFPGRPMDEHMAEELRFRGGSPSGHVSRSLTPELMADADLVLTFEYAQLLRIIDAFPDHRAKVLGLRQFTNALDRMTAPVSPDRLLSLADASALDSMAWDIEDPHGQGPEAARRCADEVDEALRQIASAVGAQPDEFPTRAARHRGRGRRWSFGRRWS